MSRPTKARADRSDGRDPEAPLRPGWENPTVTRTRLLGLGIALALADSSVVTLALPDILRRFDLEIAEVAWVLTSYNLGLALAAVPAAYVARRRPVLAFAIGTVVFAGASLACGLAPSFAVLLAGRGAQAVGGALLVCASLDLLSEIEGSDAKAVRVWAAAGIAGAALGPAAGGILTETLGWESIFLVQAPLALLTLARRVEARGPPVARAGGPALRCPPNLALLLLSGALTAALFLLVLLLVDGWRLTPIAAAAVVTVMPAAAVAGRRLAPRVGGHPQPGGDRDGAHRRRARRHLACFPGPTGGGRRTAGVDRGRAWVSPSLRSPSARSTGARRRRCTAAGRSPARHAGVVVGLVLLTPVFTNALDQSEQDALEAGAAAVLDSRISPTEKIGLAQDVLAEVAAAEGELPDIGVAFEDRPDTPEYDALERSLDR